MANVMSKSKKLLIAVIIPTALIILTTGVLILGNPQWHKTIYLFQKDYISLYNTDLEGHLLPNSDFTGSWQSWHNSGELRSIELYVNGQHHGVSKYFYGAGGKVQIKSHGNSGALQLKLPYVNGTLEGISYFYYDTGPLENRSIYVDNLLNGKSITFYPSGNIKATSTYINGEWIGLFSLYSPNGELTRRDYIDASGNNTIIYESKEPKTVISHDLGNVNDNQFCEGCTQMGKCPHFSKWFIYKMILNDNSKS
jgi:antitoxin component YwqK of YwqJK toxin-antitoxin module